MATPCAADGSGVDRGGDPSLRCGGIFTGIAAVCVCVVANGHAWRSRRVGGRRVWRRACSSGIARRIRDGPFGRLRLPAGPMADRGAVWARTDGSRWRAAAPGTMAEEGGVR